MARIPAESGDLYADAASKAPESMSGEMAKGPGTTATLPKEILMGKEFEPGDKVILRIEEIGDDSIVVSYDESGAGEEESYGGGEEMSPPMGASMGMGDLMG